jgi:flagellar hook assembly protein FlgD
LEKRIIIIKSGVITTDVRDENSSRSKSFHLFQNFPNPFNPSTMITFSVPQTDQVHITIYNILGQEVRTLFAGQMERGAQTLPFDGKDQKGRTLCTGTYICRMNAGAFVETKKMTLIK